jgi:parvulin-like peptidyl-prolyl isomerase
MTVLTVNGEEIEESAIQQQMASMLNIMMAEMEGEDPLVVRMRAREWAEENLIEATLLRQLAMKDPQPPEGCSAENEVSLRLERLVARITAKAEPPRRKDVVAFYTKNRESFYQPERIRAAHIVKNVDENNTEESARAAIEQAQEQLHQGRPFGEVANELSDCAGKGGDLGYFERGNMVDAFDDVVFKLQVNQVSSIFRTEFGFHIATVLERLPAGIPPFAEVSPQIEAQFLEQNRQQKLNEFLDQLRLGADIRKQKRPAL